MQRKNAVAGAIIAGAVLLLAGRWVIASRQDASDQKEAQEVERKFVAQRAAANGATPAQPGGMWAGGGAPGQRRRGGGGGPGGGGGGQRGQGRQRMMEAMAKEVGLNPTQMKQVQAIQQSSRPMMGDVRRNPKMSREDKQAAMKTIREAQQTQMNKILTPDQQTKYAAFREKTRALWQARRQGNGGPGGAGPGAGGPGGAPNGSAGNPLVGGNG